MSGTREPFTVVVAEDDRDDQLMIEEAFNQCPPCNLDFVGDGEQLLDYLRREGEFAGLQGNAMPRVILLDLNMPKVNGLQALREIKADPGLRLIPVVVITTSHTEEDLLRSYDLGVTSFITKSGTFDAVIASLYEYWSEIVAVPN